MLASSLGVGLVCAAMVAITPPAAGAVPSCRGYAASIIGTPSADRLIGTDGRDVIVGLAGSDKIVGRGGDDVICGNAGDDHLSGGAGDDRAAGRAGTDTLRGGPGDDVLDPGRPGSDPRAGIEYDRVLYDSSVRPVTVRARTGEVSGAGHDRVLGTETTFIIGSVYGDRMYGDAGSDQFTGGGGPDVLLGRRGRDTLFADDQSGVGAVVRGGAGNDWLDSSGAGTFRGGSGDDSLGASSSFGTRSFGGPGDDFMTAYGRRGVDVLRGGRGNDALFTDEGPDRLFGGSGRDELWDDITASPRQVLAGGRGRDTLRFSAVGLRDRRIVTDLRRGLTMVSGRRPVQFVLKEVESIDAERLGRWVFWGTSAADRVSVFGVVGVELHGRSGADHLTGTSGDDLLDGGPGTDSARPRVGNDSCRSIELTPDNDACEQTLG